MTRDLFVKTVIFYILKLWKQFKSWLLMACLRIRDWSYRRRVRG